MRHAPARDEHATLVVDQELSEKGARAVQDVLGLIEGSLQVQEVSVLILRVV